MDNTSGSWRCVDLVVPYLHSCRNVRLGFNVTI